MAKKIDSKETKKIHIILQGKGGVGKSVIASLIAQYKIDSLNQDILCIDTDPLNATFAGYKRLNVSHLNILENDDINPRLFDNLIETILAAKKDVVIDNGTNSFVPLSRYLITNRVASLLKEYNYDLIIHIVITGGQALLDTLSGFDQLITQFDDASFLVWLNPYWGQIAIDNKNFEDMKTYQNNKEKIAGIIRIPTLKKETYEYDFKEMLQNKKTFLEALHDENINIMAKQRLKIIRDSIFSELSLMEVI